ncbi:MAG: hypothetical protein H5T86_09160 [Armatimonadetes bacterium]|nr:hypothetical protein [Armatimonadota bacterium]
MPETTTLIFDKPGPENTEATLRAAAARAAALGIDEFVVATTTGRTALLAADICKGRVIGVHLSAGLWKVFAGPDPEIVRQAEAKGVRFLTATHTLMGGVDSAVQKKFGGTPPADFIAHVLYLFGQGTKVAVEVAVMAADAGLLSMEKDVIAIAGTHTGADTALVIKPAYSHDFFDLYIREVIAKPGRPE